MNHRFANFGFIAAMLVVLLHVAIVHPMVRGFCGIAVPFFFFASGWFLSAHCDENEWWKRALKQRVRTLLIPFLCFNGMCWLTMKGWSRGWSIENMLAPFGLSLRITEYNVLWFLRSLMLLVFVSPVLVAVLRKKWFGAVFLASSFVMLNILTGEVWCFVFSFTGLFYFSAGMFSRIHNLQHGFLGKFGFLYAVLGVLAMCYLSVSGGGII